MAYWHQVMLQDAGSSVMEFMTYFYDEAMMIVVMIIILILYILFFMMKNKFSDRFLLEGQFIEIFWTLVPMGFLTFLAIPSLKVLYISDEVNKPLFTVKAIGHQWYWEYEYIIKLDNNDYYNFNNFDSMMSVDLSLGCYSFRLLDVSENLVLPYNTQIRLIILSDDVIHSFTIPALGIKADAIPGRLNQVSFLINRPGVFLGQCSEICGVNHSFMPIVIESISMRNFMNFFFFGKARWSSSLISGFKLKSKSVNFTIFELKVQFFSLSYI